MKELIEYIIKNALAIDNFSVEESTENDINIYTIKVPEDKFGLVIGKHGNTINAIRNVVKIKATFDKVKCNILVSALD